jgi:hypothetical protein
MSDGKFLSHHATETHTKHCASIPAESVEEPSRIVCISIHRIGPGRTRRLTKTPLIVGEHFEMFDKRPVGEAGFLAQIPTAAIDEE